MAFKVRKTLFQAGFKSSNSTSRKSLDIASAKTWDSVNCPSCGISYSTSKDKCPRCGYQDVLASYSTSNFLEPMEHQIPQDLYENFLRGDFKKIMRCLKKYSKNKKSQSKVFEYLDYSVADLYGHINKNLSWWNGCVPVSLDWNNYGDCWEVDHIKPLCHGDFRTLRHCEKFKSANSLQNLRVCPTSYNRLKGSWWNCELHTWNEKNYNSYHKHFHEKRTPEEIQFIDKFEDFYQKSCIRGNKTKLEMNSKMLHFFKR